MGSPIYPGLLQQMKPGSSFLTGEKKAGQGMVPTGLHTLVSRWRKAVEVDSGFVEKIGFGDIPSHLNICHFNDFIINIGLIWRMTGGKKTRDINLLCLK
jgi:hypothetical protein